MGELETTLLLEFEHESGLCLFLDLSLLKQSFGETIDIKALKYVLVKQVAENLDHFIDFIRKFLLLNRLELLLEHLVQVEDESLCSPVVHIKNFLKGHLYREVNTCVSLHGLEHNTFDSYV